MHNLIARVSDKFDEIDVNHDGYLSGDEIERFIDLVLKYITSDGRRLTAMEHNNLRRRILRNCNLTPEGYLYKHDAAVVLSEAAQENSIREAARAKFRELDSDGSGYLDNGEIQRVAGTEINYVRCKLICL